MTSPARSTVVGLHRRPADPHRCASRPTSSCRKPAPDAVADSCGRQLTPIRPGVQGRRARGRSIRSCPTRRAEGRQQNRRTEIVLVRGRGRDNEAPLFAASSLFRRAGSANAVGVARAGGAGLVLRPAARASATLHPLDPEIVRWHRRSRRSSCSGWSINLRARCCAPNRQGEAGSRRRRCARPPDPRTSPSRPKKSRCSQDRLREALKPLKRGKHRRQFAGGICISCRGTCSSARPGAGKTTALVNCGLKFPLADTREAAGADGRRRHAQLRLVVHRRGGADRHRRPLHDAGQPRGGRQRRVARLPPPAQEIPPPAAAERRAGRDQPQPISRR